MSREVLDMPNESSSSQFLQTSSTEFSSTELESETKLSISRLYLWLSRDEVLIPDDHGPPLDDPVVSTTNFGKRIQKSYTYRPNLPRYLKLIKAPWSTICEKILFALYEKELDFQCITFDTSTGNNLVPIFLEANPKAHNPVLITDTTAIADSMCIIEYLEQTFSPAFTPLIPPELSDERKSYDEMIDILGRISLPIITYGAVFNTDLTKNWKLTDYEYTFYKDNISRWQANLNEFVKAYPKQRDYYAEKGRELQVLVETTTDKEQVLKYFSNMADILKEIEIKFLMRQGEIKWLCGPCFTFADISLAVLLHRLEFLGLCYWYCYCSNVSRYYEEVKKLESFRKIFQR